MTQDFQRRFIVVCLGYKTWPICFSLGPSDRAELLDANSNWRQMTLENRVCGWADSIQMEDEEMNPEAQPLSE